MGAGRGCPGHAEGQGGGADRETLRGPHEEKHRKHRTPTNQSKEGTGSGGGGAVKGRGAGGTGRTGRTGRREGECVDGDGGRAAREGRGEAACDGPFGGEEEGRRGRDRADRRRPRSGACRGTIRPITHIIYSPAE